MTDETKPSAQEQVAQEKTTPFNVQKETPDYNEMKYTVAPPKGYIWTDKFINNQFASNEQRPDTDTPYVPQAQALQQMPNWEKLTPFEQKVYGEWLPGIAKKVSQTRVGQWIGESIRNADKEFESTTFGKILTAIDYLHDRSWDEVGVWAQMANSDIYAGAYTEEGRKERLLDARAAGSFLQEFANLPHLQYEDGELKGFYTEYDLPGIEGVIQAREKITALRLSGMSREEAMEQVRYETFEQYGALAMRMQMQDLASRIFLDPLNPIMAAVKPVKAVKTTATTLLDSAPFMRALEDIVQGVSRSDDLVRLGDDIFEAGLRLTDEGIEAGTKVFRVTEAGAEVIDTATDVATKIDEGTFRLVHYLAHAEDQGKVLGLFDKLSLFLTGGARSTLKLLDETDDLGKAVARAIESGNLPWYLQNTMEVVANTRIPLVRGVAKMFTLTEDAKAMDALGIFARHFETYIMDQRTPEGISNWFRNFANNIHSKAYAHASTTLTGRVAQRVARSVTDKIDNLLVTYRALDHHRSVLGKVAEYLKISDTKVFEQLMTDGIENMVKRMKDAGVPPGLLDDFTDETVQKVFQEIWNKTDKDWIPFTFQEFQVKAGNIAKEAGERIALETFGVQKIGIVRKVAEAMKAAQTLAFLRLNPAFPIRNYLNNVFTMFARGTGIDMFTPMSKIDDFLKRLGGERLENLWRVDEAYTWTGDTLARGAKVMDYRPGELIRKAQIGDEIWLDSIRTKLNNLELGAIDMGKLSSTIEMRHSKRAYYSFYRRAMRENFWKPGVSFEASRTAFDPNMVRALGDELFDAVDNIIRDAGMSGEGLVGLNDLLDADATYSWSKLLDAVEEKTGIKTSGAFGEEFLSSISDELPDVWRNARTTENPNLITDFINEKREMFGNYIDELADASRDLRVGYATTLTEAEGYMAIPTLVGDTIDDLAYTQIGHNMRMYNLDPTSVDKSLRNATWRRIAKDNQAYWNRHWNRMSDTYDGIKHAANKLGMEIPDSMDEAIEAYGKVWTDFFGRKEARMARHFDELDKGAKTTLEWEQLMRINDDAYEAAMRAEMQALEDIDDALVAMIATKDPDLADEFASWRLAMREMRGDLRQKTVDFNRTVRLEENALRRNQMWKAYQIDNMHNQKKIISAQREGLIAVYGDSALAQKIKGLNQTAYNESMGKAIAKHFGMKGKVGDVIKPDGTVQKGHVTNIVNQYLKGKYGDELGMHTGDYLRSIGKPDQPVRIEVSPEPRISLTRDELDDMMGKFPIDADDLEGENNWSHQLDQVGKAVPFKTQEAIIQKWVFDGDIDGAMELIRASDNPVGTALSTWQRIGIEGGMPKSYLIDIIRENPEEARRIQNFAQWNYRHMYGDTLDLYPTHIEVYRAASYGVPLRPYESVTSDIKSAISFMDEDAPDLYRIQIPVENIFTGSDVHPAMLTKGTGGILGDEAEIILNELGARGAKVQKISAYGQDDIWDIVMSGSDDLLDELAPYWDDIETLPHLRAPDLDTLDRQFGRFTPARVDEVKKEILGDEIHNLKSLGSHDKLDLQRTVHRVNEKVIFGEMEVRGLEKYVNNPHGTGKVFNQEGYLQVAKDYYKVGPNFDSEAEVIAQAYNSWTVEGSKVAKLAFMQTLKENPKGAQDLIDLTQWYLRHVHGDTVPLYRVTRFKATLPNGEPNVAAFETMSDISEYSALTDELTSISFGGITPGEGQYEDVVQMLVPTENIMFTPDTMFFSLGDEREFMLSHLGNQGVEVFDMQNGDLLHAYERLGQFDEVIDPTVAHQFDQMIDIPEEMVVEAMAARAKHYGEAVPDIYAADGSLNLAGIFGDQPLHTMPEDNIRKLLGAGGPMNDQIVDSSYGLNGAMQLDEMNAELMRMFNNPELKVMENLTEEQIVRFNNYLNKVRSDFGPAQIAGRRMAEFGRDSALLNYRRRHHFDNAISLGMPYGFWMTNTMINWVIHSLDRPQYLSTALRLKEMLHTVGAPQEGMPSRLRGSVKIPFVSPPEWLGDTYFVNPFQWVMPFDQMAYPFEKVMGRGQMDEKRAESVLREMVKQGTITQEQMDIAIETGNDTWKRAITMAKGEGDRDDNFDILNTFSSVHAPIQWGIKALTGQEEDIGPLTPLGRTAKKLFGLMGVNPMYDKEGFGSMYWTATSSIRAELGLHPFDKWEDYRVDRAIANMVAMGEISPDEGMRAMLDRGQNELFQEAAKRAAEQYARGSVRGDSKLASILMFVLNNVGLPVYVLPEGEDRLRQLQEDFSRAYVRQEEEGDMYALNEFFEKHPEYEARLALWKEPQERMQTFLVDEIWNMYNELGTVNKRILTDALGQKFVDGFINKETRNYDAFDARELGMYLKMMGGSPPGSLNMEVVPIEFAPTDIATRADAFYKLRRSLFPNYYKLQNTYFDLTDEGKEQFLRDNTELKMYWDWRNDYFHRNPDILPYVDDDYELKYQSGAQREEYMQAQPNMSRQEWTFALGTGNVRLCDRLANGEKLPSEAIEILREEAEGYGMTLEEFVAKVSASS